MSGKNREGVNGVLKYPIFAAVSGLIIASSYFYQFHGKLSNDQAIWGVFGDYVGGILNPIVGLITIVLLVHTLQQNQRALHQNEIALEQNREELELSRVELKNSADALREQAEHMKKQAAIDALYRSIQLAYSDLQVISAATVLDEIENVRAPLGIVLRDHSDEFLKKIHRKKHGNFALLAKEYEIALFQLRVMLLSLEEKTGDDSLSEYFKLRLSVYTHILSKVGILSNDEEEFYLPPADEAGGLSA